MRYFITDKNKFLCFDILYGKWNCIETRKTTETEKNKRKTRENLIIYFFAFFGPNLMNQIMEKQPNCLVLGLFVGVLTQSTNIFEFLTQLKDWLEKYLI